MKNNTLIAVQHETEALPDPIIPHVEANPLSVLLREDIRTHFFAEIEKIVSDFVPDLSTKKSRLEIGSLAFKIAKTKTAILDAGKAYTADMRQKVKDINALRDAAVNYLEALQKRARAPLTKWEEDEAEKQAAIDRTLKFLESAVVIQLTDTSDMIAERLADVQNIPNETPFITAKEKAVRALEAAYKDKLQAEADRQELIRLREIEVKRAAEESERLAAEQKKIAEEEARKAAEETARLKKEAELAAEAKRKADAEIERLQAEKDALEKAEIERRQAEVAAAKRAKNREHISTVLGAVKTAIMTVANIDEATAKTIVSAIAKHQIPHTTIDF